MEDLFCKRVFSKYADTLQEVATVLEQEVEDVFK